MGLHQRYATLLDGQPLKFIAGRKELEEEIRKEMTELFTGMMKAVFSQEGAQFTVELLETPKVQEFIGTHARVLDMAHP